MTRRRDSVKARRICFDTHKRTDALGRVVLDCHICDGKYGVILPGRMDWEAEHVIPHAWDGKDIRPAHVFCHKEKTKGDVTAIAKSKRVRDRQYGIKRSGGTMPGSKRSKWKKKMSGEVERRS